VIYIYIYIYIYMYDTQTLNRLTHMKQLAAILDSL
jgi:hypothetical protein